MSEKGGGHRLSAKHGGQSQRSLFHGLFEKIRYEKAGAEAGKPNTAMADDSPVIILPPRPNQFSASNYSKQAVTPGRSLTASVLGRGPTDSIHKFYKVGKRLGAGQFGTVHLCREISSGELFACKSISRASLISEEDVEDVRTEVSIMYHLAGQPNIVKIRATFEDRHHVYLVMELCEGGELFDQINARVANNTVPYSERDASQMAKGLVRAVERCHARGVIHRDLKPENFLLTSKDLDASIKAADFGLASFYKPGQTFTRVCGSAMYMAPEIIRLYQRRLNIRYGPEVDIFSAGVIIYILLCGCHPFPAPSNNRTDTGFMKSILVGNLRFPGEDWVGISENAKTLLRWMMKADPKQRPTAEQVLNHPWIQDAPESPLEAKVVKRFETFLALVQLKKFKKLGVRVASTTMEESEILACLEMVAKADHKRIGFVTIANLLQAVEMTAKTPALDGLKQAIQETEVVTEDYIDYEEFFAAAQQMCHIEKQENLFQAFSLYDQDLSGYISIEELEKACREFKLDPLLVSDLAGEVNRDEDGHLDYNEFVAMMRKEAGGLSRRSVERSMDDGSLREKDVEDMIEMDSPEPFAEPAPSPIDFQG
eukprot:TRINITY_DN26190_c0_g1_i1.p1 TRINITY_DN26190_c0_g1~~TRINITY_DN26190_c0_g1_i1.p1  ORF type:complete len:598 (+),score=146.07 TRINITY_DN26190_c0_g1_i1:772-2565(+)